MLHLIGAGWEAWTKGQTDTFLTGQQKDFALSQLVIRTYGVGLRQALELSEI